MILFTSRSKFLNCILTHGLLAAPVISLIRKTGNLVDFMFWLICIWWSNILYSLFIPFCNLEAADKSCSIFKGERRLLTFFIYYLVSFFSHIYMELDCTNWFLCCTDPSPSEPFYFHRLEVPLSKLSDL